MKTMQNLILEEVAKTIENNGLTPAQKSNWANTGAVYAMDGLQSRCKLNYDFQDGYFSMTLSPVQNLQTSPPLFRVDGDKAYWGAVKYDDGNRIKSVLHELAHCIQGNNTMTGKLISIETTTGSPFGHQWWTIEIEGEKKSFAMWEDISRWPRRGNQVEIEPLPRMECYTGYGKIILEPCARLVV